MRQATPIHRLRGPAVVLSLSLPLLVGSFVFRFPPSPHPSTTRPGGSGRPEMARAVPPWWRCWWPSIGRRARPWRASSRTCTTLSSRPSSSARPGATPFASTQQQVWAAARCWMLDPCRWRSRPPATSSPRCAAARVVSCLAVSSSHHRAQGACLRRPRPRPCRHQPIAPSPPHSPPLSPQIHTAWHGQINPRVVGKQHRFAYVNSLIRQEGFVDSVSKVGAGLLLVGSDGRP